MRQASQKKLFRVLDANYNRAKEGLRVCEDVCRFILNDAKLTAEWKALRHALAASIEKLHLKGIVQCREIEKDVGRDSSSSELKRQSVKDIFWANAQRVKESLRVLEEFAKLYDQSLAKLIKKIRYKVYAVEKKVIERF